MDLPIEGTLYIVVGGTGSGKTTWTKHTLLNQINKKRLFIWDVNNEYNDFPGAFKDVENYERFFDMIDKLKEINTRVGILIEDAGHVISHNNKLMSRFAKHCIKKRHSKNCYILFFHSLRMVPLNLFVYTDYLIMFKTNDNEDLVSNKFAGYNNIIDSYNKLRGLEGRGTGHCEIIPLMNQ